MDRLKGKYEKLYQMVLKIFESERMLLQKARALNKEVIADQKKFQRFQESQKQEKVATRRAAQSPVKVVSSVCFLSPPYVGSCVADKVAAAAHVSHLPFPRMNSKACEPRWPRPTQRGRSSRSRS